MKIAVIGYGAMGKLVRAAAETRGHQIVAAIDPKAPGATATNISPATLAGAEVAIDFSLPSSAVENIRQLCAAHTSVVIGTTGWYEKLDEVKQLVDNASVGLLYSANFSVGVHLFLKIVEEAARLVNAHAEFDIWGHEIHHYNKADSPSGTARSIEKIILAHVERKTAVVENKLDRRIEPHELHYSSTRAGAVNFSHTVGLDSPSDSITITHAARNRNGYAEGAVQTAEWLHGKKGFFTMTDYLQDQPAR